MNGLVDRGDTQAVDGSFRRNPTLESLPSPRINEATADLAAIVGEGRSCRIVGPRARRYAGPHPLPVLMHMHVHPRRWGSGNADASVHRRVAVHHEFVYVLGKHP